MRHVIALLFLLSLLGCETTPTAPAFDQPAEMPTYGLLVSKHNERIQGIKRFWARSVIEVRWVNEKGDWKFEQGEGHLVLDLPLRSSLTVGKLDIIKFWAGSNETFFWLFDELEEPKKLYLGRHDGQPVEGVTGPKRRSPLPVRPVDMPRLLGILPIDGAAGPASQTQAVQWVESMFMIQPAGESARYYFHPITYRMLRVDLLSHPQGEVVLTARLDKPERIEAEHAAIGPFLNTWVEVVTPGTEGKMTLYLSGMTDAQRRVNPRLFDLDVQREIRQPELIVPVMPR